MHLPQTDISLLYSGGSGGFLFLHWLLLDGYHWCKWPDNRSTEQIIAQQWAPKSTAWKSSETWPINDGESSRPGRVYFHCLMNHVQIAQWQHSPGTKVLLYTDLSTQLRLAHFKKAKWFDSGQSRVKTILRNYWECDGERLHQGTQPAWTVADQRVKLQYFVSGPHNPAQQTLINNWRQLHPESLLAKTGL